MMTRGFRGLRDYMSGGSYCLAKAGSPLSKTIPGQQWPSRFLATAGADDSLSRGQIYHSLKPENSFFISG